MGSLEWHGQSFCAAPQVPASCLTKIQWIAFLRIIWFRTIAERRLNQLVTMQSKQPKKDGFCQKLIDIWKKSIQKIHFPTGISITGLLDRFGLTDELRPVSDAIAEELTDEFYYGLRGLILRPFCKDLWCPIGIQVLNDIGHGYAKLTLKALEESKRVDRCELEAIFIKVANDAAENMQVAGAGEFQFSSGTPCEQLPCDFLQRVFKDDQCKKSRGLIDNNDKIPKALHSLAHKWLSGKHQFGVGKDVMVSSDKGFLVLCATEDAGSLKSFVAEVEPAEEYQGSAALNQTHYKVWQIAYVLMTCARQQRCASLSERVEGEVSRVLGIDKELMVYAYRKGMSTDKTTAEYLLYQEAKKSVKARFKSRVRSGREDQKRRPQSDEHDAIE